MKSKILQLAASVPVLSAMSASGAIRYVDVNNGAPTPPYTNWTSAATTIQDAVDAAVAGDQILVTNGVYQTGGRVVLNANGASTNRVAVDKAVTVQSVNGTAVTLIQGDHVMRCVYLTNGAALVGFTLTKGLATYSSGFLNELIGGGVLCESASAVVSNCVVTGNSAYIGGGASGGTLNNCTLSGNSASDYGGGAYRATLNNCIVYYHTAGMGDNYSDSSLSYSCTTPLPPNGVGNISAEPQLTDLSHLSAGSPCRGAGSAAYAI